MSDFSSTFLVHTEQAPDIRDDSSGFVTPVEILEVREPAVLVDIRLTQQSPAAVEHARLFCLFDAHVAKRAHARAATDIYVATQTSSLHVKSIFFHTSHDYMAVVHMDTIQGRGFGWVGGVVFMAAYTKKLQLSWMMVLVVFMLMARMMALEEHAERMLVAGLSSGLMMCNVTGFCIYLWLHVYTSTSACRDRIHL